MKRFLPVVALAACLMALAASTCLADARADYGAAMRAMQSGDVDAAQTLLDKIIASGEKLEARNLAGVYNFRGMCQAAKGDNDKAMADFNKALELDPAAAEALGNRAFLWQALGDEQKAREDAQAAKRIDRKVKVPDFK